MSSDPIGGSLSSGVNQGAAAPSQIGAEAGTSAGPASTHQPASVANSGLEEKGAAVGCEEEQANKNIAAVPATGSSADAVASASPAPPRDVEPVSKHLPPDAAEVRRVHFDPQTTVGHEVVYSDTDAVSAPLLPLPIGSEGAAVQRGCATSLRCKVLITLVVTAGLLITTRWTMPSALPITSPSPDISTPPTSAIESPTKSPISSPQSTPSPTLLARATESPTKSLGSSQPPTTSTNFASSTTQRPTELPSSSPRPTASPTLLARATESPTTSPSTPVPLGAYLLSHSYISADVTFFDQWNFFDQKDPTDGDVQYLNREAAVAASLANASASRVFMGADMSSVLTKGVGRASVRIESKEHYNEGLFVIRLDHIPTGCSTWPAFWMFGDDADHPWPTWGEYDIIEGTHTTTRTMTTLHTGAGCDESSLVAGRDFSSEWGTAQDFHSPADNCDIDAPGQWRNQGCSQIGPENSMGESFNSKGGGTYAAEWAPSGNDSGSHGYIRTWYWPNSTEPLDLKDGKPSVETWGQPYSYFHLHPSSCSAAHFQNMRLVFDLTFCGAFGTATFQSQCPLEATSMSCDDFVEQHPERMTEAYWSIRTLDVYKQSRGTPPLIGEFTGILA